MEKKLRIKAVQIAPAGKHGELHKKKKTIETNNLSEVVDFMRRVQKESKAAGRVHEFVVVFRSKR